jgi:hypothetical protein
MISKLLPGYTGKDKDLQKGSDRYKIEQKLSESHILKEYLALDQETSQVLILNDDLFFI